MFTSRARKRLAAGLIAVVATVAGIAFANFVSEASTSNSVKGGHLTVTTADLPLDFGDQTMYPSDNGGQVITSSFTVTNNNPVLVGYALTSVDTNAAGSDAASQYKLLHIHITTTTPANPGTISPLDDEEPSTTEVYDGYLEDLVGRDLKSLGSGASQKYDVAIWLERIDPDQTQDLLSTFDLKVTAVAPPAPGGTASHTAA